MPRTLEAVRTISKVELRIRKVESRVLDRIVEKLEKRIESHRLKLLGTRG